MKVRHGFLAVISTLVLAGLLLFGMSLPVAADDSAAQPPAKAVMTLKQQTKTARDGTESLVLVAKLTQADGYPLSERTIYFSENNDVFGQASIPIGTAVTSSAGFATLTYSTRLLGTHSVSASFPGDQDAGPVQVAASFELTSLPPMEPLSTPTGMEEISHWTLLGVGVVALVIWLVLLGVLVGVRRGIAGRSA